MADRFLSTKNIYKDGTYIGKLHAGDTLYIDGLEKFSKNLKFSSIGRKESTKKITITARNLTNLTHLEFIKCNNIIFNGNNKITIHSQNTTRPPKNRKALVIINESSHVDVSNCIIYSIKNSMNWSERDWKNKSRDGVAIENISSDCAVKNNIITNVYVGIRLNSPFSIAKKNTIKNFAGDGILITSSKTKVSNNIISNSYMDCIRGIDCGAKDKKGNHNDGIQVYLKYKNKDGKIITPKLSDIEITGNTIYCPSGVRFDEETHGIASYDNPVTKLKIIHNKILVQHTDGIALKNTTNCTLTSNIVVPVCITEKDPATIKVLKSGNGNTIEKNQIHSKAKFKGIIHKSNIHYSNSQAQKYRKEILDIIKGKDVYCPKAVTTRFNGFVPSPPPIEGV